MKHNGNPIEPNVSADLATAMKTNPRLKVMVNGGYYDLATPFFARSTRTNICPFRKPGEEYSSMTGTSRDTWCTSATKR